MNALARYSSASLRERAVELRARGDALAKGLCVLRSSALQNESGILRGLRALDEVTAEIGAIGAELRRRASATDFCY